MLNRPKGPICPSIRLSLIFLSFDYLIVFLSICLSIYLPVYLSLSVSQPIYPAINIYDL